MSSYVYYKTDKKVVIYCYIYYVVIYCITYTMLLYIVLYMSLYNDVIRFVPIEHLLVADI